VLQRLQNAFQNAISAITAKWPAAAPLLTKTALITGLTGTAVSLTVVHLVAPRPAPELPVEAVEEAGQVEWPQGSGNRSPASVGFPRPAAQPAGQDPRPSFPEAASRPAFENSALSEAMASASSFPSGGIWMGNPQTASTHATANSARSSSPVSGDTGSSEQSPNSQQNPQADSASLPAASSGGISPVSSGSQSFSLNIPFSAGTDAAYSFSDATRLQLSGGLVRLVGSDQTDSDDSTAHFGSATMSGLEWDNSNGLIRLNTTTNNMEMDATWTPSWGNLVGYWKLNGSGAIANNATIAATVGTSATAKNTNGAGMAYQSGQLNQAVTFDGVDDNILLPNLGLTSGTVALWLKPSSNSNDRRLLSQATGAGTQAGLLSLDPNNNAAGSLGVWDGSAWHILAPAGSIPLNKWTHVLVVYSGGNATAYVNGALQLTGTSAFNASGVQLTLGGKFLGTFGSLYAGAIDELAIWSTALSAAQIRAIYDQQAVAYSGQLLSRVMDGLASGQAWNTLSFTNSLPFYKEISAASESASSYSALSSTLENGLVALWHLNETSGTSLNDASGNGNNLTTHGNMTLGGTGKFGNSIAFDGGNGTYANAPDTTSLRASRVTVSLWAKGLGQSTFRYLVAKEYDNQGPSYGLYTGGASGLKFIAYDGGTFATSPDAGTGVWDNRWHHFVGTYDGGSVRLYVDGAQVGGGTAFSSTIAYNASDITLGSYRTTGPLPFTGSLDEVGVWNRALSAAEILELYRRGANRVKFQVRSCSAANCSDQSALSTGGWLGPDGTNTTFFSELYNTNSNALYGTVSNGAPTMTFANFTGLTVAGNRYFQYRAVLESDDANNLCNYGSGATACSPELQSVSIGPTHYDSNPQSITSTAAIGANFVSLDANGFTETLGSNGCSAGTRYALSADGTNYYYWNGSAWAASSGYATAASATLTSANLGSFSTSIGWGTLQVKTYLLSNGTSRCEVDNLLFTGMQ
jgi:trimeric autotransporter adhesin